MEAKMLEYVSTFITFAVIPYIVYNHKRVDKCLEGMSMLATKIDLTEAKVENLKDDIKEIKFLLNKLVDLQMSSGYSKRDLKREPSNILDDDR